MFEVVYYCFLGLCLAGLLRGFVRHGVRTTLLILTTFSTFFLGALPLQTLGFVGQATVIQVVVCSLAIVYGLLHGGLSKYLDRLSRPYVLAITGMLFMLVSYNLLSHDLEVGFGKSAVFAARSILPILALVAVTRFDRRDLTTIFKVLTVGSAVALLSLLAYSDLGTRRVTLLDNDPIYTARTLGLGLVIAAVYLYSGARKLGRSGEWPRIAHALTLFGLGYGLVLAATRGPIVGLIASFIAATYVDLRIRRRVTTLVAVSMIGAIGLGMTLLFNETIATLPLVTSSPSLTRIVDQFSTLGENDNDQGRLTRYKIALNSLVATKGLGIGTGSFAEVYSRTASGSANLGRDYAHNIVLEVGSELGLPGLLLFAAICAITIKRLRLLSSSMRRQEFLVLLGLVVYAAVNSLVSGDIGSNYMFWVFCGIAALSSGGAEAHLPHANSSRTSTAGRVACVKLDHRA